MLNVAVEMAVLLLNVLVKAVPPTVVLFLHSANAALPLSPVPVFKATIL